MSCNHHHHSSSAQSPCFHPLIPLFHGDSLWSAISSRLSWMLFPSPYGGGASKVSIVALTTLNLKLSRSLPPPLELCGPSVRRAHLTHS